MPNCWANCLGDCDEKQSREHIVSRSLFESDLVDIVGFPWCKTPMRVGKDAVTRKILCVKHNNLLSELDQAAKNVFEAFREQSNVADRFPAGVVPTKHSTSIIDALRLERWLLKTLINVSYEGKLVISSNVTAPGLPDRNLVEIAFGRQQFSGSSGMYVATAIGQNLFSADVVQFAPLIKNETQVVGALFTLRGLHLVLMIDPSVSAPGEFAFNRFMPPSWRGLSLSRKFERIDYAPRPYFIAHQIYFDWGGR